MSAAYIVKFPPEIADGDYIGLFVVPSKMHLWSAIDEFTDPSNVLIKPVVFAGVQLKREKFTDDEGFDLDLPMIDTLNSETGLSDQLINGFMDDRGWKPFGVTFKQFMRWSKGGRA